MQTSSDGKPLKEFEVSSPETLTIANFLEPKIRAKFYESAIQIVVCLFPVTLDPRCIVFNARIGPHAKTKNRILPMSTQLQTLLNYCSDNERVCPLPDKWKDLWTMLPNRSRQGSSWEPALPLILAAWYDTPAMLKMLRLREHLEWSQKYGALNAVDKFLRDLPETDWHHLSD